MEDKPTTPLPQPIVESNPTPPTTTEQEGKREESPPEVPPTTQPPSEPGVGHWHRWRRFFVYFVKVAGTVFATGSTLLFLLALWDSYRPKITITPGGTLNAKSPFGTYFIVQNQGALPISKVTYLTHLSAIDINQNFKPISSEQNISVIPQMKTLESYTLPIRYQSIQTSMNMHPSETTNQLGAFNHNLDTNVMKLIVFVLSFNVSYEPKFFGKRTDTLFFFAAPDVDGNWQWFPSAHASINEQTIDTNLIPRIPPSPVTAAIPTNGGTQVHTNQAKPK